MSDVKNEQELIDKICKLTEESEALDGNKRDIEIRKNEIKDDLNELYYWLATVCKYRKKSVCHNPMSNAYKQLNLCEVNSCPICGNGRL